MREGWYRARWKDCRVAPWRGGQWCCVKVENHYGTWVVWSEEAGWCELGAIEEWGERVWMPGDRV